MGAKWVQFPLKTKKALRRSYPKCLTLLALGDQDSNLG
jgi:hypothetical protein